MGIEILKKNKFILIFALIVTLIHVVYATVFLRAAYLDGAMLILVLLNKFSNGQLYAYSDIGHTRFFINFFNQLPMIIGYFILMIKSKYWLSVLFSLPLFLFPPLILWWNWHLCKRTQRYDIFAISALTYGVLLLPFTIFSIVEIPNAVMLQFVLLNYLVGKIDYTKKDLLLIAPLLVFLFGSQEYTLFIGIILFLGSLYYAFKEEKMFNKIVKYVIGLGGISSSIYIINFITKHSETQSEASRFIGEAFDFWKNILTLNSVLSVTALLILFIMLFKKKELTNVGKSIIILTFGAILTYMFFNLNLYLCPMWEGHFRTIPCWAVPLIFVIIVFSDMIKKKMPDSFYTNMLTIALICTIAQTIWQINNTYWFNKNIDYMKKELQASPSAIYEPKKGDAEISSFFNPQLRRYIWNFSYTATSILFAPDKKVEKMLMPPVEDTDQNNFIYKDWLYVKDDKTFFIPTIELNRKNEFWDATEVTKAMDDYSKAHNFR